VIAIENLFVKFVQIVAIIEIVGWTAQFVTHGFYEVSVLASLES
jgi:uncharacterized membrane protein YGL010W